MARNCKIIGLERAPLIETKTKPGRRLRFPITWPALFDLLRESVGVAQQAVCGGWIGSEGDVVDGDDAH